MIFGSADAVSSLVIQLSSTLSLEQHADLRLKATARPSPWA
jgi:hypothetical protein